MTTKKEVSISNFNSNRSYILALRNMYRYSIALHTPKLRRLFVGAGESSGMRGSVTRLIAL
jgi:hypothetical protein